MAKPPRPIAPCKLCGRTAELHDSHIIPRWTYKRTIKTGGGDPNLVTIVDDVARRGGKQLSEHMLCTSCESIVERAEGYLAKITLQEDDRFPALEAAVALSDESSPGILVADVSSLDLAAIEHFAISVVWRASASRVLDKVSLGPRYHALLGTHLQDAAAPRLPSEARLLVELIDIKAELPRFDRVVVPPHSARCDGYFLHRFSLFGMAFNVVVGSLIPSVFDVVSLRDTGKVLVTDGTRLVGQSLTETMQRVLANGGLRSGRRANRPRRPDRSSASK